MKPIQTYGGPGFQVSYDPNLCIHAGECARGLPAVFVPKERPWVRPGAAAPDEVAEVIARCPSGALQFVKARGSGTG